MSDLKSQQNGLHKILSRREQSDKLGVLNSTREIVLRARSVSIQPGHIERLAQRLVTSSSKDEPSTRLPALDIPAWSLQYHFFDGTSRTVNWILLLDALNFCFWGEKGEARWQVNAGGENLNGYLAEAVALRRAVEEQIPVWDAEYLSNIDQWDLATIFRSSAPDGTSIPLFEERLHAAREVGQVLLERFGGEFSHLIEQVHGSGVELAHALAQHFTSFRDIASYEGHEVYFLKRAQICVADLHSAFKGQSWGAFADLDQLTIFADYKLPQVLRHWGVLVYTPELAARVDNQEQLAAGGREEEEIRSATIWASELLRRSVARLRPEPITAVEIDQILWHLSQDATAMRPYHRVRTIYY